MAMSWAAIAPIVPRVASNLFMTFVGYGQVTAGRRVLFVGKGRF